MDIYEEIGFQKLGLMNKCVRLKDPRRLVFTLSRYKFASKTLIGMDVVAKNGCDDVCGARILKQSVKSLTITDYDKVTNGSFLRDVSSIEWSKPAHTHDILACPLPKKFDGIYILDVLEHL